MYQISSNSATIKLNDEEKGIFNQVAENLQTLENRTFTNSKQVFFGLIQYSNQLETELQIVRSELENLKTAPDPTEITSDSNEIKQQLITAIGYEEPPTDDQLYTDLLEIITTPLDPAPTVEIEKEVIKEVERQLGDNEFLLHLKSSQTEVLKTIARWRFMTREDDHTNNIPQLILRMLFNKGVLLNWHGQFPTGITENHFKKTQ